MELEILRKKLSTFRTETGKITKVSEELLYEILIAWEEWTGPAKGFYSALGADHRKMASLIGRAKKLKREGQFPTDLFKEIKIAEKPVGLSSALTSGIEVAWTNGRLIRFAEVAQLVDFLNKLPQFQCEACEVKKVG